MNRLLGCLCVVFAACAVSPVPCGPPNCEGCCDLDGGCQAPALNTCATSGEACVDCAALCGDAGCECSAATCVLSELPPVRDAGAALTTPRFVDSVGFTAQQLGVIVNLDDPASVMVATYYARARGIPPQNVVELHLGTSEVLEPTRFAAQRDRLLLALQGLGVRALVLTGLAPFRVGCMSVTSAFALGFDLKYCSTPCALTTPSPPLDAGVLPTMLLAGRTVGDALALIHRGLAADHSFPSGDGFLVRTHDEVRNVRWPDFQETAETWSGAPLALTYIDAEPLGVPQLISNQPNLLFYFTGLATVPGIGTNRYLPGAVADHLTSYGGQVPDSPQMSALRWLEAGATASYGTVIEPCNYVEKFPKVSVLLEHYYRGEPIIEAYWRSVEQPGEGLFIGEPLAAPFGRASERYEPSTNTLTLRTTELTPGHAYVVEQAAAEAGPWAPVLALPGQGTYGLATVTLTGVDAGFYRLVEP